jgi:hypothetical protein
LQNRTSNVSTTTASRATSAGDWRFGSTGGPTRCRKKTTSRTQAYEESVPFEESFTPRIFAQYLMKRASGRTRASHST